MDLMEFNELIARAVSRGLKEGVNEKKMDPMQMIGALEFQKAGIVNQVLAQSLKAQKPVIVAPAAGAFRPGNIPDRH